MWSVRCTCHDCYLHVEQLLPSLPVAEVMAYAHEQRWASDAAAHVVMVKEYKPVQPSVEHKTGNPSSEGGPAHA